MSQVWAISEGHLGADITFYKIVKRSRKKARLLDAASLSIISVQRMHDGNPYQAPDQEPTRRTASSMHRMTAEISNSRTQILEIHISARLLSLLPETDAPRRAITCDAKWGA